MKIYTIVAGKPGQTMMAFVSKRDADAYVNNNMGQKFYYCQVVAIDLHGEGEGPL